MYRYNYWAPELHSFYYWIVLLFFLFMSDPNWNETRTAVLRFSDVSMQQLPRQPTADPDLSGIPFHPKSMTQRVQSKFSNVDWEGTTLTPDHYPYQPPGDCRRLKGSNPMHPNTSHYITLQYVLHLCNQLVSQRERSDFAYSEQLVSQSL